MTKRSYEEERKNNNTGERAYYPAVFGPPGFAGCRIARVRIYGPDFTKRDEGWILVSRLLAEDG